MKFTRASGTLTLAVLATLASPFAVADDMGWYGGLNLGRTKATIDDPRITASLLGAGFATTSITDDNRDNGYKLFMGYQHSRYFAIEGGFFDLGEFGFTANTIPAGTLNGNIKLRGINLDAVGILPITERFSAFGRVGANYAEARDSFSGTGAVRVTNTSPKKRDTNLKVGLGLQYALTPALGLRLEAERFRVDDAVGNKGDIDFVSLGLVYRFNTKQPVTYSRAATPEPVAIAPDPPQRIVTAPPAQPQPPAPPPPVVPTRFTFSADALFDFDKAVLKPDGKQQLDKFVRDLTGTQFGVITVTGHTDRIGSQAYNQRLSTRRAEAVKSYLVETGRIPASVITATGMVGSAPVTKPGDCKGNTATRTLVACLQPDRRVEVEVTGTK